MTHSEEQHFISSPTGSVRSQHGPIWGFFMHRVINPAMRRALTSRFHAQMGSDKMMVLNFQGRRSGRFYSFPIGYMQIGNTLFSYSPFSWWRNLEGGVPVSVELRGRTLNGMADVSTNTEQIASGMDAYLRNNPGDAKYFKVALDDNRQPSPDDIPRAAQQNVQIRIELD
jgi:hypothetical protein